MDKVTSNDIDMMGYFWTEKGDIERWCDWEKRKPAFKKEFPELFVALENYNIAEKTLNRIIQNIIDESYKY